jgi:2-polyprenyl-3-methyl-5-hydroxy-6-metoxy-1,4-benzoquinol methylase
VITAEQERGFYDATYTRFLELPDHALRVDRQILKQNLNNPAHPSYERRRLYRASMEALEAAPLAGKKVLDYGCGPCDFGIWMATEGAEVTLLDLSPVAIEVGLKRANASRVRVRGIAADASRLSICRDGEFDLVFASAALHHTLKYPGAIEELARVMRPGARLVLCETWGANPVLNMARRVRAALAAQPDEQGEEIILSRSALRQLDPYFTRVSVEQLNLLGMGKRLLRGRFPNIWARRVLGSLEAADMVLLRMAPVLRNWCGEAVITAERRSV